MSGPAQTGGRPGRSGNVEYEVSLSVAADIADDYLAWLQAHIGQLLALPGFVQARLWRVEDPAQTGRVDYCVRYRLADARALDAYLQRHAAAMRQEGLARFGAAVRAHRRILRPLPAPPAPQQ